MTIRFEIPKRQLGALEALRDLERARLRQVAERLSTLDRAVHPEDIIAALDGIVDAQTAALILQPLISLHALKYHRHLSEQEVFEGVTQGLEELPHDLRWSAEQLEKWNSLSDELEELFKLPQLHVVAKAIHLSYDYAKLLQEARIITDLRPVFDEDASKIEGVVISQTLRIFYDSADRNYSLSLSVDAEDIRGLKKQCERALKKVRLARKTLALKQWGVVVPGDNGGTDNGEINDV